MPALFPAFSRANGLGREFFLQALVTGIVTNRKQKKIPFQITGKIMFEFSCVLLISLLLSFGHKKGTQHLSDRLTLA